MDKNPKTLNQIGFDLGANNSKRTICMQYKMGNCLYGKNCRYAHVEGHNSNFAKNRSDEYNRDNSVSIECNTPRTRCCWFWSGKICHYGKNCIFLHDESVANSKNMSNRKTMICHKWEKTGSCLYGTNCRYAHGQDELLRTRSQFNEQREAKSHSRIKSATAAPHGPYSGKTYVSARNKDKEKCLFNWNKKLNGVYADWID